MEVLQTYRNWLGRKGKWFLVGSVLAMLVVGLAYLSAVAVSATIAWELANLIVIFKLPDTNNSTC